MSVSRDFFIAKAFSLLHDPPHKSWVLEWGLDHESAARSIRNSLLRGTILYEPEDRIKVDNAVKRADILASSFDRWLMGPYERAEYKLLFDRILNIFNPSISSPLSMQPVDRNSVEEKLGKFIRFINDILVSLSDCLGEEGGLLVYSTLYSLLEPVYYYQGLPSALADTRVPTHTVFDHLYAAASMVNAVWNSVDGIPSGYLVLIDIPGVKNFIFSSRKAGDYWAGSWILSNVMWGLLSTFVEELGPDTVLSPSLRFNIYLYDWLIRKTKECSRVRENLKSYINAFLKKLIGEGHLEELISNPLIPATALVIIPKVGEWADPGKLEHYIWKSYEDSWKNLVEELFERAKEASVINKDRILEYKMLRYIKDIIELPPKGLRLSIVDLEYAYRDLVKCLSSGDKEACLRVGISIASHETLNEILEKLKRFTEESEEYVLSGLSFKLLFHIASRMKSNIKTSLIPSPRAFWVLRNGKLKPISNIIVEKGSNWLPCTLCGDEPSVIRLRKELKKIEEFQYEEFKEEDLKHLYKSLSMNESELSYQEFKDKIKRIIKPGESLGPYCLYKRLTYSIREDLARFQSTEDVALSLYIRDCKKDGSIIYRIFGLKTLEVLKEILDKIHGKRDLIEEALEYLCQERGKDVDYMALSLGLSKEELLRKYNKEVASRAHVFLKEKSIDQLSTFMEAYRSIIDIALKRYPKISDYINIIDEAINVLHKDSKKAFEGLKRLLSLRTKYLIVYADGDNVGKIHGGFVGLNCTSYVNAIMRHLVNHARVEGAEKDRVLNDLKARYELMCSVSELVNPEKEYIIISPTYKQSLSLSLILTSLKDITLISASNGMLIYTGGDDALALAPVDSIINMLALRGNYGGEDYFHKINGIPMASAIPFGRSISIRVTSIYDIMSEEIARASEVLEEAKTTRWTNAVTGASWEKDTLVLTDSRKADVALLPLTIYGRAEPESLEEELAALITAMHLSRISGILSGNLPEDAKAYFNVKADTGHSEPLIKAIEYVIHRNAEMHGKVQALVSDLVARLINTLNRLGMSYTIGARREHGYLPLNVISSLYRILRDLP